MLSIISLKEISFLTSFAFKLPQKTTFVGHPETHGTFLLVPVEAFLKVTKSPKKRQS